MELDLYDALGRKRSRNEIPVASGQFVENGIVQSITETILAATGANQYASICSMTLTGDGINGMVLEGTMYGPYGNPAVAGEHFNVTIHDGAPTGSNRLGATQFRVQQSGHSSMSGVVRAYVPPFTGTKTFHLALESGAAHTIRNQAGSNFPTWFTAQWAHPTKVIGPQSPPAVQWTQVPFNSGWSNYAAPYGPVMYCKTPDGVVHLKGLAAKTAGATTTAFVLPAGFRPNQTLLMNVAANVSGYGDTYTRLDIDASGNVFENRYGTGPSFGWFAFSNVSFIADQ